MLNYFFIGSGAGILLYLIKLAVFYVLTSSRYTRWVRAMFHSGPIGLIALDFLAGIVIGSTIATAGAGGLVVLFVLIGFMLASIIYILIHLTISKGTELYYDWRY